MAVAAAEARMAVGVMLATAQQLGECSYTVLSDDESSTRCRL